MSRILVIDDDPGNRLIVKSRLSDLGFEVRTEETGANGLVGARSAGVDLVVVAAGLGPGIDATEVCRRLKGIPETATVPVLIYSNLPAGPDELARSYEAGCDAFLPKQQLPVMDQVVRALLRTKSIHDDLTDQVRVLEQQNRRLGEERQTRADREISQRKSGENSLAVRELAAERPDGLLVVDGDGFVRFADRGACTFFGNRVDGKNLGSLAPASGLEAFVRDARSEPRDGFRFDLAGLGGRSSRSLSASVVPLVTGGAEDEPGIKIVLLLDAGKRRLAEEMLRVSEPGIPRQQLGALLDAARLVYRAESLVGESSAAQSARETARRFGRGRQPVLIVGPEGIGKVHLARTMHYGSSLPGPFLQTSCAALAAENLARELFGCVAGGCENAITERPGLFQRASDGTLLLEGVNALTQELQRELQRVLETGAVRRVGSERAEPVDARVIATCTEPLDSAVSAGHLAKDLAALFAQETLELPALSERMEDVYALALYFLALYGPAYEVRQIDDEALSILTQHPWPQNVAELEEAIRSACAHASDEVITPGSLPQSVLDSCEGLAAIDLIPSRPQVKDLKSQARSAGVKVGAGAGGGRRKHVWDITEEDPISLEHYEMKALMRALDAVGGDKLAAARLLNVGKSTLYRKLKRFDLK